MLHTFDCVDDAIPERPQDECEENQLDESNEDEPMEEHQQAQDHLEHLRVEMLLSLHRLICEGCITLARWVNRFEEDSITVEEPD